MAITKDDVFRVADKLFGAGTAPSLVAIRTELGTGSYSTISGYLTEWKSASRNAPPVGQDDAPDDVKDLFEPALRSMWAMAQAVAKKEYDDERESALNIRNNIDEQLKEMSHVCEHVQSQNDQLIEKTLVFQSRIEEFTIAFATQAIALEVSRSSESQLTEQNRILLSKVGPVVLMPQTEKQATKLLPVSVKKKL